MSLNNTDWYDIQSVVLIMSAVPFNSHFVELVRKISHYQQCLATRICGICQHIPVAIKQMPVIDALINET